MWAYFMVQPMMAVLQSMQTILYLASVESATSAIIWQKRKLLDVQLELYQTLYLSLEQLCSRVWRSYLF